MRDDFLIRIRRRLSAGAAGERGSALIMALMLMLIFAVAGVTLAAVIGVNARLTLQTSSRGTSVYVAEAGLETALGMLRSASTTTSGAGYGDPHSLPCQVTGTADGSTDPSKQYSVTISYGVEDPSQHATDAAWLAHAVGGDPANPQGFGPISCTPGSGTGTTQPYYALVESAAAQGAVGARTLLAVYSFNLVGPSLAQSAGGLIKVFNDSTGLCLRAESVAAGSKIDYTKNCDRTNVSDAAVLSWVYGTDYKIMLANSASTTYPNGLCIAGPVTTSPTTTTATTYSYYWSFKLTSGSTSYTGFYPHQSGSTTKAPTTVSDPSQYPTSVPSSMTYTPNYSSTTTFTRTVNGTAGTPSSSSTTSGGVTTVTTTVPFTGWTYTSGSGSSKKTYTGTTLQLIETATTATVTTPGTTVMDPSNPSVALAELVDCATGSVYNASGTPTASATTNSLQWGWGGNVDWQNRDGYCLWSGYNNDTSPAMTTRHLSVESSCPGGQNDYSGYNPLPQVGAGNASEDTGYIVNYLEFGRCVDVKSADTTKALIAYPCKQDPTAPYPAGTGNWNQGWTYSEPSDPDYIQQTTIYTTNTSGTKYCLVDPKNSPPPSSVTDAGDTPSPLVQLSTNCTQNAAKWTRYTWTGRYQSSYIFVSSTGLCLTSDSTRLYNGWSLVTVAACNGSAAQKWNAPANLPQGGFGDYQEIPAGGA